jgi:hypothetical protein
MNTPLTIALGIAPLAGFLAWRTLRFHVAAKAKAYEAKKHRAKIDQHRGDSHPPSWHDKANLQEEFLAGVDRLSTRRRVPRSYAQIVLRKEVNARRLSWYVGAMEDQGASWMEQQMAVADQISEWWTAEERAKRIFD